jgi:hypothetical protein
VRSKVAKLHLLHGTLVAGGIDSESFGRHGGEEIALLTR